MQVEVTVKLKLKQKNILHTTHQNKSSQTIIDKPLECHILYIFIHNTDSLSCSSLWWVFIAILKNILKINYYSLGADEGSLSGHLKKHQHIVNLVIKEGQNWTFFEITPQNCVSTLINRRLESSIVLHKQLWWLHHKDSSVIADSLHEPKHATSAINAITRNYRQQPCSRMF